MCPATPATLHFPQTVRQWRGRTAGLCHAGPRSTWAEDAPARLSPAGDGPRPSWLGGRGSRTHFTPALLDLTPRPPRLSRCLPSAAWVCPVVLKPSSFPARLRAEPENTLPRSAKQAKQQSRRAAQDTRPLARPWFTPASAHKGPTRPTRCPWREASKLMLSETKKGCDTSRGPSPCRDVVCVLGELGTARGFRSIPVGGGSCLLEEVKATREGRGCGWSAGLGEAT